MRLFKEWRSRLIWELPRKTSTRLLAFTHRLLKSLLLCGKAGEAARGLNPWRSSLKSLKIQILHHFPEQAGCLFHRKIKFYCGVGILPARKGINEQLKA